MKRRLSVLALIAALAVPLPTAAQAIDFGAYLAAHVAMSELDFAAAERYLGRAIAADPDNPALLDDMVVAELALGHYQAAEATARRLEQLSPESHMARLVGLVRETAREDPAALRQRLEEKRGIGENIDPVLMAWAEFGAGRVNRALELLDRVADRPVLQALSRLHKAYALAAAGDFEHAARLLSGPSAPPLARSERAIIAHAQMLVQLDRRADVLALLDEALAGGESAVLGALRARIAAGQAVAWDVVRDWRDGVAETLFTVAALFELEPDRDPLNSLLYARAALRLRPDHVDALLLAARSMEATGRHELALELYAEAPREHPAWPEAEIGRAEALHALGRSEEAIAALRALVEQRPEDREAWSALGDMMRRLERWEEAEAAYSRAIDLLQAPKPRDWALFYVRGIARERQGKWPEAEADLRKALELSPGQPSVLNYLGYSLVEKGMKLDEALEMIRQAVEARPDDGYILDSLAWALFKLGRHEEAVAPMERAALILATDPIVNDHLGDIYWMVGRRREAVFQWKRALSFGPEEEQRARILEKLEKGLDAVLARERAGNDG